MSNGYIDYNNLITKICNLSPDARKTLDMENDRINVEKEIYDDRDMDYLYKVCLVSLVDDLRKLGINNVHLVEDIFTDGYITNQLLEILNYVFPGPLYERLRYDERLYQTFERLLSEELEEEEKTISKYIEYLFLDNEAYDLSMTDIASRFIESFSSVPLFTQCMTGLKNLVDKEGKKDKIDLERSQAYTKYINDTQSKCYSLLEKTKKSLRSLFSDFNETTIRNRFAFYFTSITKSDVINEYSWLFQDKPRLTEVERFLFERAYKKLITTSMLYVDYHVLRQSSQSQLVLEGDSLIIKEKKPPIGVNLLITMLILTFTDTFRTDVTIDEKIDRIKKTIKNQRLSDLLLIDLFDDIVKIIKDRS